jgi:hypothetical protein
LPSCRVVAVLPCRRRLAVFHVVAFCHIAAAALRLPAKSCRAAVMNESSKRIPNITCFIS